MWQKGRNGANPSMVPPWGKGSSSRSRTHGRDALSGGNCGGGGSRHGGGGSWHDSGGSGSCRSKHGDDNNGYRRSRGRRILPHFGPKAVSYAHFHHGWVGEGEKMERMGGGGGGVGGGEVSEVIWHDEERRKGGFK